MTEIGPWEQFATRYRLELVADPSWSCDEPVQCTRPSEAEAFLRRLLRGLDREALGALFLDTRNRCIGYAVAYVGTLRRVACEPRGILVPALLSNACGVILFHNHPSGDPTPSPHDLLFTRQVHDAASLLGIQFVDHLILGEDVMLSMQEFGGW